MLWNKDMVYKKNKHTVKNIVCQILVYLRDGTLSSFHLPCHGAHSHRSQTLVLLHTYLPHRVYLAQISLVNLPELCIRYVLYVLANRYYTYQTRLKVLTVSAAETLTSLRPYCVLS